jgi:hypothetical protein
MMHPKRERGEEAPDMFIVHLVGTDDDNPFKIFITAGDARKYAEKEAAGNIERVFVYEWSGDWREGLAAAKDGRLDPKMHYAHREAPLAVAPEKPLRLPKRLEEKLIETIKKMPKIARKF